MILWVGDYIRTIDVKSIPADDYDGNNCRGSSAYPWGWSSPGPAIITSQASVLSPDRRSNKDSSKQSQSDFRGENSMRSISANDPRQNLLRTVVASSSLKLQIRTILGFRHPSISIKKELP